MSSPRLNARFGTLALLFVSLAPLMLAGCSRNGRTPVGDAGGDTATGPCVEGAQGCLGRQLTMCMGGADVPTGETCPPDNVCVAGLGCRTCTPGRTICVGNEVHVCDAGGDTSTLQMACAGNEACRSGACVNACAAAADERSNVGCEYWAVDLDNEYGSGGDAAGAQYAIVIANPSDVQVTVLVEQNDAPIASPSPSESLVGSYTVPPQGLTRIDLPQREIDCSSSAEPSGIGTCVTGNAYKVTTNFPVVAYQFNPIIQQFSNDASLLIPATGIDTKYRVLGWPTANPIAIDVPGLPVPEGIPDHSTLTVVATQPATNVRVTLGGPIVGNAEFGIAEANAGDVVEVTLNEYGVLNLSSRDIPGDLSGSIVEASLPVAVFSGGERGIAPIDMSTIEAPPGGWPDDICCTEHLEEQVFPTTAWGKEFVITRSPTRSSDPSWREPDIYRVMADKPGTTVTTNLPAPNDSFTLGENEWREFSVSTGFIMQASEPVSIQQILVSQGFIPSTSGPGGDPSMLLFPPYEQYRDNYIFYVPETFTANYVVIAMPESTVVELDMRDVNASEFMSLCAREPVGMIGGVNYIAATCPVDGGTHRIRSSLPVGIMVYGYYNVGSYGYAGGSNLTRINFI